MRTVVVTGTAGCGSSSVARALAHRFTGEGKRTILLQEQVMEASSGGETGRAWDVRGVDPLEWGESAWTASSPIRRLLGQPLSRLGATSVLPMPGLAELAWWGVLREVWAGKWDVVVVDAGAVGPAQRMLTLPDSIVGMLRRAWPLAERTGAAAGVLESGSWHLRALARLDSEAAELAAQVRSGSTSLHLVTKPSAHELQRVLESLAPLALFELPVTEIVLNHADIARPYDRAARGALQEQLPGVAVRTAVQHSAAPRPAELASELYGDVPDGVRGPRPRVGRSGEHYLWNWQLPFADAAKLSAVADTEDLMLKVGPTRRVVPLPSVLRRCTLQSLSLHGAALQLRFAPDPKLWPATGGAA